MAILVGIDEAGYGPLLGPLMVASATFSVPDELLKSDHWHLLSKAVGKHKKGLAGRLLITDSKKAYVRTQGLGQLRRTVLAGLLTLDRCEKLPKTVHELLASLTCPSMDRLAEYKWYKYLQIHKLTAEEDAIQIASNVLKNTLKANNMAVLDTTCRCLDVGYYNKMVDVVKNKASVLFTAICELISHSFTSTYAANNNGPIQIIVDRQGGRVNYASVLRKMFPQLDLRVIRQDEAVCSYELSGGGKSMKLHFAVKADLKHLPVALASMTAKYVRELLVYAINAYFISYYAHLKPTAGYWQDGQRFIKDIQEHLPDHKYDPQKLIRQR